MPLVLKIKSGDQVRVGDDVVITVLPPEKPFEARISVEAPQDVKIGFQKSPTRDGPRTIRRPRNDDWRPPPSIEGRDP